MLKMKKRQNLYLVKPGISIPSFSHTILCVVLKYKRIGYVDVYNRCFKTLTTIYDCKEQLKTLMTFLQIKRLLQSSKFNFNFLMISEKRQMLQYVKRSK